jgi:5-carboxymethyl-2-hydroxymuconate isomerase
MPQISVDYSAGLADDLDRPALGRALNALAVKHLAAAPEACKTRFRRADETVVVGGEAEKQDLVLVEFHVFPGRTTAAKAGLAEAVVALLAEQVTLAPGRRLHAAAKVVEVDGDAYRKATLTG